MPSWSSAPALATQAALDQIKIRDTQQQLESARPLPPGERPTLWASENVVIGDRNINLDVTMRPSARVSGQIVFKGTQSLPDITRYRVWLEPTSGPLTEMVWPAAADLTGQFTVEGGQPGRYVVRAKGEGQQWFFRSATLGGLDRADVPIELSSDALLGLSVEFSDTPAARVSGYVTKSERAFDAGAWVLLFPADPDQWTEDGLSSRRLKRTRADTSGFYELSDIPIGRYFLCALSGPTPSNWQDTKFLNQLKSVASQVRVDAQSALTQDLKGQVVR
jgi:hypothetical protein